MHKFIQFLDWDGDSYLNVSEVAIAFSALLPVDEESTEAFIRDHFDVGQDGLIAVDALQEQILPYCGERLSDFLAAAPVTEVPRLCRGASQEELRTWFDYWGTNSSGELDISEFRLAVSWLLYQAMDVGEEEAEDDE